MRLGPLLRGQRQFVVPYFQRGYSWRRRQWTTLFDDILELYELQSTASHFLGSMVLLHDAEKPATSAIQDSKLVIDGQQRLVTLSLFLAAIRDVARRQNPDFAERLHTEYLVDKGEDDTDYPKIVPTNLDRAAFTTVIQTGKEPDPSPIRDAYRTFKESLQEQLDKGLVLERLVEIVIAQLSFVAITLDAED